MSRWTGQITRALLLLAACAAPAAAQRASFSATPPVPDSDSVYARDVAARQAPVDEAAFARRFRHDTARVNGIAIHFVSGGRGEPLVLLHGWTQTWRAWRRVMPELAERYTLVVPDLRGFGVRRAGHFVAEERPVYFTRVVTAFLARRER